jgi:23S rRNA (cytosine1962-C5)-methyltransferase
MLPTIQILSGHHKRFVYGYPWLYANEIIQGQATKDLEPGQLVSVEHIGQRIATGYFNRHSLIAFRCLSRIPDEAIDTHFFKKRLQQAVALRERFYETPFYRLIHAEADGLPGLIIDRFDKVFVVQINTHGMEKLTEPLLEAMQALFNPTTLYLKTDSPVRKLEGLAISEPVVIGQPLTDLTVIENNTTFTIDMTSSQKTGWFFDHRDNRKLMADLAKGKTVIDYFCYSGGFGLQAATHKARHVIGVDGSEAALKNARRSAALNNVSDNCEFICFETFKDMDQRSTALQTFDIVILDPPAFVKTKKDLGSGLKGYEKLLTKAIPLVSKNGLLMIASCSFHVKEIDLKASLVRALHKNHCEGKIVKTLSAGVDHPIHPLLEESGYLKGFLVALD